MFLKREMSCEVYRALREAPEVSVIVDAAHEAFTSCHPDPRLQPLVVVVTALDEAGNIGTLLDEVPARLPICRRWPASWKRTRADFMSAERASPALPRTILAA
jgi:hypothetical protein